jgi:hypothetical protein
VLLLHQDADVTPFAETPAPSGVTGEVERRATAVAILNRQGAEGTESLQRLSTVAVDNPLPLPEPAMIARVQQTAEASAGARASAATATAVARGAEVTAVAEATAAAQATATAISAEATASAASTATAVAAVSKPATPAAASPVARAPRATPEAAAAMAAVAPPLSGGPPDWERVPLLPAALLPAIAGLLAVLIWRRTSEPFVLKAKPARA